MPSSPEFPLGLLAGRRVPGLGFGLRHAFGGQAGSIALLVILVLVVLLIAVLRRNR